MMQGQKNIKLGILGSIIFLIVPFMR